MICNNRHNVEQRIAISLKALKVFTIEDFPTSYAAVMNQMGHAYNNLGKYTDTPENYLKAINCLKKSLLISTAESSPSEYAISHINLSTSYIYLSNHVDPQKISSWHSQVLIIASSTIPLIKTL